MKIYGSSALHRGEVAPSLAQEKVEHMAVFTLKAQSSLVFFAASLRNYGQKSYSIQKWNQSNICYYCSMYYKFWMVQSTQEINTSKFHHICQF